MRATVRYVKGASLPMLAMTWRDRQGIPRDFSNGWTFQLKLAKPGKAPAVTKTSGLYAVTPTADEPASIWAEWSTSAEITTLPPGLYRVQVLATRTSDGRKDLRQGWLEVLTAI